MAGLAFLIALGLTIWAALDFLFQFNELSTALAAGVSPTAAKVARYIAPLPSALPTESPSPISTATAQAVRSTTIKTSFPTATRTSTPTKKPTTTPTAVPATAVSRARAAAATTIATPTRTATPSPVPTIAPVPLGETYGTLAVLSGPLDRPAEKQADLNLSLRGFSPVKAQLGLVDYTGDTDAGAPQLAGLFSDGRTPNFATVYQVFDWIWSCNCRGPLITDPEVTLVGMTTTPGEALRVPGAGAEIGIGYQTLLLYADSERAVLKYTRNDSAADGYALHVEGIAMDSSLLSLYQRLDEAGRGELPALRAGQAFARARGAEIRVAIRDTGTFMDPRSRKDWWHGR